MLSAIASYIRHHQQGVGITGVSNEYAKQIGVEVRRSTTSFHLTRPTRP